MKFCRPCKIFFGEQVMDCQRCRGSLEEVTLMKALELTKHDAFRRRIIGPQHQELPDAYKQYHIRSYLGNRSLFLDYDLHKNRLKHGRRLKRFFVAPVNIMSIVNLPWFLFNVITTNLFHLQYTAYCQRCDSKVITGRHTPEECDYNIEYYNILDDILKGRILDRKPLYQQFAKEQQAKGKRSAYQELFERPVRWEIFWDLMSIGSSIAFWIYTAVYISYPMFQVLMQKLEQIEAYQFTLILY